MVVASTSAIPFNRAHRTGAERRLIESVLAGGLLEGDGPFTARASAMLTKMLGSTATLLTTSCTHALELSALLLDLRPGDEVIMPSFTFPSTANAYVLRGAVPVFVDCRPDTLNLDERQLEAAVTDRTRAIVTVHYGGVGCAMDAITGVADRHGLVVVEDNAHGLGGTYRGRPLGSIGGLATQSFHATKNAQCGEGGALVINRAEFLERAEFIREKGTNRTQYYRGEVDRYRWVDVGSSYLPSELLAAFLTAQLEHFTEIQKRRHEVWAAYHERLATWAVEHGVGQPTVPDECEHPAHLYYLLLPDLGNRQAFQSHLNDLGIHAAFHYQPLHNAPAGQRYGRTASGGCPLTEQVADRLIRLPLYPGLTDAELDRIVDAITCFRPAQPGRPAEIHGLTRNGGRDMSVDGNWTLTADTPKGSQNWRLAITTAGDSFSGTMTMTKGSFDIEDGRVDGNRLSWVMKLAPTSSGKCQCNATYDGESISGEIKMGVLGTRAFSGSRA